MKTLRYALALIILIVLFIFSAYNAQLVRLSFFEYQTPQLPLFLVLIFVFFLGLLLAGLFNTLRVSQLRRQIGQLQREVDAGNRQREAVSKSPATKMKGAGGEGNEEPAGQELRKGK
jgi:uncharacterized integral membrane protein